MEPVNKTCARLGIKPGERVLVVRIGTATLQFFRHGELVKSYGISTSKRPPSNIKNSRGTPCGLHEIAERIGAGQPPGMVFSNLGYQITKLRLKYTSTNGTSGYIQVLDNLTKGSSGQAIQNANLMLGLDETMGLMLAPMFP